MVGDGRRRRFAAVLGPSLDTAFGGEFGVYDNLDISQTTELGIGVLFETGGPTYIHLRKNLCFLSDYLILARSCKELQGCF